MRSGKRLPLACSFLEKLTAADGIAIPENGLLETIGLDEDGNSVFQTDVPLRAPLYVQELETDEHYV